MALCDGNSRVTGDFSPQKLLSFSVFFIVGQKKKHNWKNSWVASGFYVHESGECNKWCLCIEGQEYKAHVIGVLYHKETNTVFIILTFAIDKSLDHGTFELFTFYQLSTILFWSTQHHTLY